MRQGERTAGGRIVSLKRNGEVEITRGLDGNGRIDLHESVAVRQIRMPTHADSFERGISTSAADSRARRTIPPVLPGPPLPQTLRSLPPDIGFARQRDTPVAPPSS